jgi:PTS system mannose-specific IIC component
MTFFYGVPFAVIAFFGILFGTDVIRSLVESIPPTVMRGMTAVGGILPALGFAILLKALWNRNIAAFFLSVLLWRRTSNFRLWVLRSLPVL